MNGKSSSVHVTLLLNFLSGDQGRLPGEVWSGCVAKGGCLGRGVSLDKGSEIRQHFIPLETESNLGGGQRVRVGGHEGKGVRQMPRAQITHCQEGVDFALSRRGNRAWDEASETREGAKDSQLSWCPPPPRLHIAVLTLGRLLPLSGSKLFHL